MSKKKATKIMNMSPVEMAIYKSKRNQRSYWQRLTHEEWIEFCQEMSAWFKDSAVDEWDKQVALNNERKCKSDEEADVRNVRAKHRKKRQ